MAGEQKRTLILRRLDANALPSSDVSRHLQEMPGVSVLDEKVNALLVKLGADAPDPEFDGWSAFEMQRFQVPDTRPRIK